MSTVAEIEDKVREIVAEQLGIAEDDIQPSSTFHADLGADPLDFMELFLAFEEEFACDIPEADVEGLDTVQRVVEYIANRTVL